jgi:nicotinate phosphoribosyltransferase
MAQSFARHDQDDLVSFELFVRQLPADFGYLIAVGQQDVLRYLSEFRLDRSRLDYMATICDGPKAPGQKRFSPAYLDRLEHTGFTGQVDAVAEGSVVFANEPLLRITAPRIQATIIEAALLSGMGYATHTASKAARIARTVGQRGLWDFSARRQPNEAAALTAARAAYIAGFTGTATTEAGFQHGLPVTGTMAHAYVQSFGEADQVQAFRQYLEDHSGGTTLLIDTYSVAHGIADAIIAMRNTGTHALAVRLDSGDLAADAFYVRAQLDAAAMSEVKIMATCDLDEYSIKDLLDAGAPIDIFGVGTKLVVPPLGDVFKLVEQHVSDLNLQFVAKKASGKTTDPGAHQVFRTESGDELALTTELRRGRPLLHPVMRLGRRLAEPETLADMRARTQAELDALPAAVLAIRSPAVWPVTRTPQLLRLRERLGVPDAPASRPAFPSTASARTVELVTPPSTPLPAKELAT